jgi:tetratricopeptide (TPR) repeat protein
MNCLRFAVLVSILVSFSDAGHCQRRYPPLEPIDFGEQLRNAPVSTVDDLNNQGQEMRKLGRPLEAVALHRTAVTKDPKSATSHYLLGAVLYDLRDFDSALPSMQKAVQLAPNDKLYRDTLNKLEDAQVKRNVIKEENSPTRVFYKVLSGPQFLRSPKGEQMFPMLEKEDKNVGTFTIQVGWTYTLPRFPTPVQKTHFEGSSGYSETIVLTAKYKYESDAQSANLTHWEYVGTGKLTLTETRVLQNIADAVARKGVKRSTFVPHIFRYEAHDSSADQYVFPGSDRFSVFVNSDVGGPSEKDIRAQETRERERREAERPTIDRLVREAYKAHAEQVRRENAIFEDIAKKVFDPIVKLLLE